MDNLLKMSFLTLISTFLFVSFSFAQSIKLESGTLDFLKGEKQLAVEYSYEKMKVGKEEESKYVTEKAKKYDKDDKGRGEKWKKSWISDRTERFEPKFEELFTKNSDDAVIFSKEAKYKMIVHTVRTEPGFNIVISRKNAEIDLKISFIEVSSGKSMVVIMLKGAKGRTFGGNDYDTGVRIMEAYAKAGKEFGKFLLKKAFK